MFTNNMNQKSIWYDICDAVWICTTDKYVNDPNRLQATLQEFEKMKIPKDMIHTNVMPHGTYPTGHLSCTHNHITVMQKAISAGHKRIFVVEDDVMLHGDVDIDLALEETKKFLHNQDKPCDIFYLGCFAQRMERGPFRHPGTFQIRKASCWALHGYIINYDLMLRISKLKPEEIMLHGYELLKLKPKYSLDKLWLSMLEHPSIDTWLILLSDNNYIRSYCIYPNVLYQKSHPSSITYKYVMEPGIANIGTIYGTTVLYSVIVIILVIIICIGLVCFVKSRKIKS